ncbi:unnamed protein product [Rotaria magnacalcarata]|uniref:Uncharacterized protein n=2 Tax=Rotaria magnacalcarata TaxID=392030 RepID=A0A817AKA4_9BILA|nr:unnamed protein product [Rotaria magnacalcarata]CAF2269155.1 unnamed protein product [Rotaria magnacalcarata]CAF3863304.1 unnamed protein product [Rotaria magnacalcarata]CAF3922730.1 unnamed protein product [Rotaria magnacalcarata]CAF3922824.1 unnamed protein product [Rotaria magnacalcarata]
MLIHSSVKRMDLELHCPSCKQYYQSPIYLPCSHSICYACAIISIRSINTNEQDNSSSNISLASDLDKLSLISDNDSGISSTSRPSSLLLPPALPEISCLSITSNHKKIYAFYLRCSVCSKMIYMDTSGVKSLPKNYLLSDIINRYQREKSYEENGLKCQLCPPSNQQSVTRLCEQCRIGYCNKCREQYHPMRGPYSKHVFIDPTEQIFHQNEKFFCHDHTNRLADFYCTHCQLECCQQCSAHINHQIISIHQANKIFKTQFSSQLHDLSQTAKYSADFLTKLKLYPDYIKKNAELFQTNLIKEIDNLILTLETKKQELLRIIDDEIERKISLIHEQYLSYNEHLQRTTGFLQFSIEALKQSDPCAYLQACHGLNSKCSYLQGSFSDEYDSKPHTSYEIDFTFNTECLHRDIDRLQFQPIKSPSSPRFQAEQCVCHDNESETCSGILAWSIHDIGAIQGFILELDNGTIGSEFRQVYDGNETMCAIDGLLSSCVYTARIKAYNQAGESAYSECITLHSSSVDWFTFNPRTTHPDIKFISNDFHSITCLSLQERIALGSRGFRQGLHYWEITIQCYDDKPDPAFGIARFDVSKDNMLGKDCKSWCMYIDSQRSWFMHNGQHSNRINGGISIGSVIGILLDLNNGTLSFYVNDQPRGPVAFSNLTQGGVYYPAVSLNKNVQLTLDSGLDLP